MGGRFDSNLIAARDAALSWRSPPPVAIRLAAGGWVLDAGKLLADRWLTCIPVPTSAATCASWTSLANIYSAQGVLKAMALRHCAELLIFDHDLVAQAPADPGQRHR